MQTVITNCPLCDDASSDAGTMDIPPLCRLLNISRGKGYELAGQDELPVPVIRLGRRMVVSRAAVHKLLHNAK